LVTWYAGVVDFGRRGHLSFLSHNEFVPLDIETPFWHRHGIRVFHRRRARLEDERPQKDRPYEGQSR
jgi:hypothetical protein